MSEQCSFTLLPITEKLKPLLLYILFMYVYYMVFDRVKQLDLLHLIQQ